MNQEVYDKEIAPLLEQLRETCSQHGLSVIAQIEIDKETGKYSRLDILQEGATIAQRIAHWGARCDANVDSLIIAIQKHAKEHGHTSMALHLLGVKAG